MIDALLAHALFIRSHRNVQHEMRSTVTQAAWSVCVSV